MQPGAAPEADAASQTQSEHSSAGASDLESVASAKPGRSAQDRKRSKLSPRRKGYAFPLSEGKLRQRGAPQSPLSTYKGGTSAQARTRSRARMVARTAEQMRRRAENERRRYTARRLASLRKRFPELPPDVLERAALRQVSVAVRRAGVGQGTLSASSEAECSPGPVSK